MILITLHLYLISICRKKTTRNKLGFVVVNDTNGNKTMDCPDLPPIFNDIYTIPSENNIDANTDCQEISEMEQAEENFAEENTALSLAPHLEINYLRSTNGNNTIDCSDLQISFNDIYTILDENNVGEKTYCQEMSEMEHAKENFAEENTELSLAAHLATNYHLSMNGNNTADKQELPPSFNNSYTIPDENNFCAKTDCQDMSEMEHTAEISVEENSELSLTTHLTTN